MKEKIEHIIHVVEKAADWDVHVPESRRYTYRRKLIDIQRELENIGFALSENRTVAAFGESQMGKSYLVSAMLSEPGVPFRVKNTNTSYNFIDEINPSAPNSTVEATGVVTRFSSVNNEPVPEGYLKVRMLSVADIVLILAEAYYNQVIRRSRNVIDTVNHINERLKSVNLQPNVNSLLSEVDVSYIEDYMKIPAVCVNCEALFSSDFFQFMIRNVKNISNEDLLSLLTLIWNENDQLTRLFYDLMQTHKSLNYRSTSYVEFKAVLRKHGSLLDVARLDEMYRDPEAPTRDYLAEAQVKASENGSPITVKKSFLSALTAELVFVVDNGDTGDERRSFMDHLDILDFPGLKPLNAKEEDELSIGLNLATVFRRGKVTYLFNKYSRAKRISSLLFCHNNGDSKACTMGSVLQDWVNNNVGKNPQGRKSYVDNVGGSPLLVIGTWFNKDLEHQNEGPDADLNERWDRRFKIVLSKDVLQSTGKEDHWFNNWTTDSRNFNNIFMLRDFKYSKTIFSGYDPDNGGEESCEIRPDKFPDFLEYLKKSFVNNEFVKEHVANSEQRWDAAATVKNDGTRLIISELNRLAPKVKDAQLIKFQSDFEELSEELKDLLMQEYHTDNPVEQIKKAKKDAGAISLILDARSGVDPYFWGRMMDAMMIPEELVYERVFGQINGKELDTPLSGAESEIFMAAGLETGLSEEENLRRLCDYLGVDTKEECSEALSAIDVDINILLGKMQMLQSPAEQLVTAIEQLWLRDFLNIKVAGKYKDIFPQIDILLSNLAILYDHLGVHKKINEGIQRLMDSIKDDKLVGMVSDYFAMSFNRFVMSYGYFFMDKNQIDELVDKNEKFGLNIDVDLIREKIPDYGIDLLIKLDNVQSKLAQGEYRKEARELQKELPQYAGRWQWQHRMRAAFAFVCGLPNYDVVANEKLRGILEEIDK